MSILTDWREQYDRMLRSHVQLIAVTDGSTDTASAEARDALIHFFEDAYHLKDWIKNDPAAVTSNVEKTAIDASLPLTICADVCNSVKHFGLNHGGRRAGAEGKIVSQSVNIGAPTARWPEPEEPEHGWIAHSWGIDYGGTTHDAATLAADIVAAWDAWLRSQGLL